MVQMLLNIHYCNYSYCTPYIKQRESAARDLSRHSAASELRRKWQSLHTDQEEKSLTKYRLEQRHEDTNNISVLTVHRSKAIVKPTMSNWADVKVFPKREVVSHSGSSETIKASSDALKATRKVCHSSGIVSCHGLNDTT